MLTAQKLFSPLSWLRCLLLWLALALTAGSLRAEPVASLDPIYLYSSPVTQAFFEANGSSYDTLKVRWYDFIKSYGKSARQISRASLLAGLQPGVLILGSAVLLDEDERRAIQTFANAGGSILATWGTGARDGRGRWTGYEFIEKLLDMKITGSVAAGQLDRFLNPFGDGPLTWPMPAGERIFLGNVAETPLRIQSKNLAGRYFNWERLPQESEASGAIAFYETPKSRRAYLGFSESSWELDARLEFPKMLGAIVAWLRREPRVFKAAWPNADLSAQLLEMDTEDKYSNGLNFARDLDAIDAQGTFYSLTSVASQFKKEVQQLAQKHEIGYHAEVHVGFKGTSEAAQEKRIKTMLEDMKTLLGSRAAAKVSGFRAPTESWDATTERLLRRNGIRHHVVDPSASEARLPFFSSSEPGLSSEDAIVVLPRTQMDDLNYLGLRIPLDKAATLIMRDFDYLHESGALGVLSVHSQNYASDGLMAKLTPPYLRRLGQHREDVWVASGEALERWWRARERVVHKPAGNGPAQMLEFSVRSPGNVKGMSFFVTHPAQGAGLKSVTPSASGAPVPQVKRIDAWRSAIVFSQLEAGNYSYRLDF